MPRINGRELADAVHQRRPELPVIYLSGYSHDVVASSGVLEEGLVLLQKPYEAHRLAAALRDALASKDPNPREP